MLNLIESRIFYTILLLVHALRFCHSHDVTFNDDRLDEIYTNTWAIHIYGGEDKAKKFARFFNWTYISRMGSVDDVYMVMNENVQNRNRRSLDLHPTITSYEGLQYARQQKLLFRTSRGYFTDPLYSQQWYLENQDVPKRKCHLDMNVVPVWRQNITGKGVIVTVVDDGIDHKHPDLRKNFDAKASHDYVNHDNDPSPARNHGTRCAGEIAASRNNGLCGVGVAFNANIGGIRMLDGQITDALEASALSHQQNYIHIFSNSWGPNDNGMTVSGPQQLTMNAITKGITEGRNGLGTIYVWATGNGGLAKDYCSCDGYVNSPYTISIGAVDQCGNVPSYAEQCPAILAVTFSGGTDSDKRHITTTDLYGKCTTQHTGSSAASPLAAGIIALLLEANPLLSWRDVQHLIVNNSRVINPGDSKWTTNGAGYKVSEYFGFGILDAGKLIATAQSPDWRTVAPQQVYNSTNKVINTSIIPGKEVLEIISTNGCNDVSSICIDKLEYVQVILSLTSYPRGGLEIKLRSPSGTISPLLKWRQNDGNAVLSNWAFSTVFCWGESPVGEWELSVTQHHPFGASGTLKNWKLRFFGTSSKDQAHKEEDATKDISKSKGSTSSTITTDIKSSPKHIPSSTSSSKKVAIPVQPTTTQTSTISIAKTSTPTTTPKNIDASPSKTTPLNSQTKPSNNNSVKNTGKVLYSSNSVTLSPSTTVNIIKSKVSTTKNLPKIVPTLQTTATKTTAARMSKVVKTTNLPKKFPMLQTTTTTTTKSTQEPSTSLVDAKITGNGPKIKSTIRSNTFVASIGKRSVYVKKVKPTQMLNIKTLLPSYHLLSSTPKKTALLFPRFSTEEAPIPTYTVSNTLNTKVGPVLHVTSSIHLFAGNIISRTKIHQFITPSKSVLSATNTVKKDGTSTKMKPSTATVDRNATVITTSTKSSIEEKKSDKMLLYIGVSVGALIVLFICITAITLGVRKYINEKPILVKKCAISYTNEAYVISKGDMVYR